MILKSEEFLGRSYFPALDGVRAVAVLSVVAWHLAESKLLRAFDGGRGVQWFFTLSGFLITTLALREEAKHGSLRIIPFYIRRAFRIMPLYLLALTAFIISDFFIFNNIDYQKGWYDYWPYFLTFMQDVPILLHWPKVSFHVAWSLGIEEKFYLAWPFLGFVVIHRRIRGAATGIIVLGLSGLVFIGLNHGVVTLASPYLPILLGCVVALALHNPRSYDLLQRIGGPITLSMIVAMVLFPWPNMITGASWYGPAYGLAIALAICGIAVRERVPFLDGDRMVWIGRRSYAVYLFHTLVIRAVGKIIYRAGIKYEVAGFITFCCSVAIALLLADLLHRWIESPLIQRGRILAARYS